MGGGRITKVLEAVSLMLSIENAPVISFLAIDPRIVIQSVEQSFGDVIQRKPARTTRGRTFSTHHRRRAHVTGWEFLEKIVQFPIALPVRTRGPKSSCRRVASTPLSGRVDGPKQ